MIIGGFDIETTGLDQEKGHRIIEVALLIHKFDEATGDASFKGKFVQRINPQRSIDPEAQRVHGIKFEDLAMSPTWDVIGPKLSQVMSACHVIVAHNGDNFDLPFVTGEFLRIGARIPDVQSVDTMLQGRWATPMGKLPNLREFCFACGVEYNTELAHAAEYDVEVMMNSFFVAYKKGFITLPKIQERKAA